MTLKIGNIYKVTFVKQEKERVLTGILIQMREAYQQTEQYHFITTKGTYEQLNSKEVVKMTSTKINDEVRVALKELYKKDQEKEKMRKKIEALQQELYTKNAEIKGDCIALKDLSGEYTMRDVAERFEDMNGYQEDDTQPTFKFYLTNYVTKYANPQQFSFLDTEYDGCLYIHDHDTCIKEYGISLIQHELESLKKQLQHTTLESVGDAAYIGDKNYLIVEKVLRFKVKKDVAYPDILRECELIQSWVDKQKQKIGIRS